MPAGPATIDPDGVPVVWIEDSDERGTERNFEIGEAHTYEADGWLAHDTSADSTAFFDEATRDGGDINDPSIRGLLQPIGPDTYAARSVEAPHGILRSSRDPGVDDERRPRSAVAEPEKRRERGASGGIGSDVGFPLADVPWNQVAAAGLKGALSEVAPIAIGRIAGGDVPLRPDLQTGPGRLVDVVGGAALDSVFGAPGGLGSSSVGGVVGDLAANIPTAPVGLGVSRLVGPIGHEPGLGGAGGEIAARVATSDIGWVASRAATGRADRVGSARRAVFRHIAANARNGGIWPFSGARKRLRMSNPVQTGVSRAIAFRTPGTARKLSMKIAHGMWIARPSP